MKLRSVSRWAFAWVLMLVMAVAVGVVTRVSHGDVSAHPEEMLGLPYQVAPFSQERFEQYSEGMGDAGTLHALEDAELVVRVQKEGPSVYRYKAFTVEMKVGEVLRGDERLQGKTISVYEPVSLGEWDGAKSLFAADAYQFGSTPMRDDGEYVLFLNYAPHNRVVGDAWTFAVSPFAKIVTDGDPVCLVHSGIESSMNLQDLRDIDMLVESERDAEAYRDGCKNVLEDLGIGA